MPNWAGFPVFYLLACLLLPVTVEMAIKVSISHLISCRTLQSLFSRTSNPDGVCTGISCSGGVLI